MKFGFALQELAFDLKLDKVWLVGKVQGIVKDYYLAQADINGKIQVFWCSSSSWVFSQVPSPPADPAIIEKLKSINNLFTGEFD